MTRDQRRRFYCKLLANLAVILMFGLMVTYGFTTGKLFDSLLFLVMWIQLELSLRQIEIYRRSLEPRFTATLRSTEGLPSMNYLEIHNAGKSVAYGVGICRVLTKEEHIPLDPAIWGAFMKSYHIDIPPGKSRKVAEIYDKSILDKYALEVCYSTDEELFRSFYIIARRNESLLVFRPLEELPGFLLNSVRFLYEYLRSLWLRYRLRRYLKAHEKLQKPT